MAAQPVYAGLRVAVFDMQILQVKGPGVTMRCRVANTGRLMVGGHKNNSVTVVELDTVGIPNLLRGFEPAIAEAARRECPSLKPGEISDPIWLNIRPTARVVEGTGCANISFDTAFVEEWGERTMRIRFFLSNKGNGPADLFAKKLEPLIKVYFVSGVKLTRGAIPAGSTSIQKGRDTFDGLLFPHQVLEGTVEIPVKDRTRFSPNIALEFDPARVIEECGHSNDVWVVPLQW